MPAIFIYLIKLSVSLAVVYLFYQLVLRKLTFYHWNRWYLLVYTLSCFLIPFVNIDPVLHRNQWTETIFIRYIPVIKSGGELNIQTEASTGYWNILLVMLASGALILFFRLLIQLFSFMKMKKKAELISAGDLNIYQVDDRIIPFSFGNNVFINCNLHSSEELEEIIRHEFVHAKQKHSFDILWSELLCLFNWYNPFAWLLRKSIRQNLEFIADCKVLENGIDKKQYQYLLLKVIGNNQFSIATSFNFSSLKKRIAMMNKNKSARRQLLCMLFLLPATTVLLLAFRNKLESGRQDPLPKEKTETLVAPTSGLKDTIPEVMTPNNKGYFIDIKDNNGDCMVVIKDKNKIELKRILLTDWNKQASYYEDLYGEIPPPPAPAPVKEIKVTGKPTKPTKAKEPVMPSKPSKPSEIKEVVVQGHPLTGVTSVVSDLKEVTVAGKPAITTLDLKPVVVTGKQVITTQDLSQVVVTGKPFVTTLDLKPVTVTGFSSNVKSTTNVNAAITSGTNKDMHVTQALDLKEIVVTGKALTTTNINKNEKTTESVLLTISKTTTREQLDEYKKQLKEKGMEIFYDEISFSKGILEKISGRVLSKNDHGNFKAESFEKLIISLITNGNRTMFRVTVQDKKTNINR